MFAFQKKQAKAPHDCTIIAGRPNFEDIFYFQYMSTNIFLCDFLIHVMVSCHLNPKKKNKQLMTDDD